MRGRSITELPGQLADWERCRPVYRDVARLAGRPDGSPLLGRLAAGGPDYVEFLATQIGIPVSIVSVGPERKQTILKDQG